MTVILVAHILVSIVLVIVVLMQRSEGGALGIGGGGGGGGLVSGRGVAGALVRTTIIFGAIFFVTSLGLTTIAAKNDRGTKTEIEENLENETNTGIEGEGLVIEGLEDILVPGSDTPIDPLADPLAVTPVAPTVEDTPATEDDQVDPLADPQ